MEKNKFDSPFAEDFLIEIPITYRFMSVKKTATIGELRVNERFSKSKKYQTNSYLNCPLNKPISNFFYDFKSVEANEKK